MSIGDTPIDLLSKRPPIGLTPEVASGPHLARHRTHGGSYSESYARVKISRSVLCLIKGGCGCEWPADWGPCRQEVVVGEVEVLVCNACLYTTTTCTHLKCTWLGPVGGPDLPGDRPSGPFLICDTCGIDGT